ncbi:hypothetical protein RHIZ_07125 [Rhizobium skierniewicense]|uniref:hypothetical protein n=1 Tax=Rhizobium skierniewicense TaxID=984260 RepID=UPI001FAB8849|nr:hypothetical protein [Rhizobium skierniewicense]MCI9865713.1 hypothetical protein [Rhizobium skierniewicense]
MNSNTFSNTGAAQSNYLIRAMRDGDIQYIVDNLRLADARELKAVYGTDDYANRLRVSAAHSHQLFICEADGKPLAVYGMAHTSRHDAVIWCCATRAMSRFRLSFAKEARAVISRWFQENPDLNALVNFTHVGNTTNHRWLKSIGAEIAPSEPQGAEGEHFHFFMIRREAHV